MATTTGGSATARFTQPDPRSVRIFSCGITACFTALVAATLMWMPPSSPQPIGILASWAVVAALADTLRVRLWDEFSFAMSLPVTLAAGMVLSPVEAAVVAFVGAFDRKDFSGGIPLGRALGNRSMAGLSIYAGSATFHQFGHDVTEWPQVLLSSMVAYGVDFAVNLMLVSFPVSRLQRVSIPSVFERVLEPTPTQTVLIYACVGLIAPVIALVYMEVGILGVVVLLLPLGLARNAYLQLLRLNEIAQRVHEKNRALQQATQQVADERRDERMVLAGELHDEVLPLIFQVHLMGQVIRQDLAQGRLLQLDDDLPALIAATEAAQVAIRSLMRDLRKSPIGAEGLISTLRSVADQLEAANPRVRIRLDLEDVHGSERALLVLYQVAQEAMSNAVHHAHAAEVGLHLFFDEGRIRLVVSDDGTGFDGSPKEGHFGLRLMRERVDAAGGNFAIASSPGEGTVVAITVPPDA